MPENNTVADGRREATLVVLAHLEQRLRDAGAAHRGCSGIHKRAGRHGQWCYFAGLADACATNADLVGEAYDAVEKLLHPKVGRTAGR